MNPETVWSRRLADELWSGVVTPLTFSILVDEMSACMVRRRLHSAGLDAAAAHPVFNLLRGHVFVNASLVADVMRELPAPFLSEGLLALLPGELRDSVRAGGRSVFSPRVARTVLNLLLHEREWLPWDRAAAFRREAAGVVDELSAPIDSAALTPRQLAERLVQLRERLGRYLEVVSWGVIYAYVFFHLTSELLDAWADGAASDLALLLAGLPGIRTFEIHDELVACAEVARRDAHLRAQLLEEDAHVLAARCAHGELGELGQRVTALIERHGHRLLARDLSFPTWRERPSAVLETIKKLLCGGPRPDREERRKEGEVVLERVLARISSRSFGALRRPIFTRCLALCREYYALRENMRYHADMFLAALRATSLAAGSVLTRRASLSSADDVFYLTIDELLPRLTVEPAAVAPDRALAERARAVRADYASYRVLPPPELLRGGAEPLQSSVGDAPVRLRGLGASPGRVEGLARVVRSIDELEAVREGEVIVAPATDPSWTSLLAIGRALVLEMGGPLSHGAIVARELGIPAVVDVPRATDLLSTGDRVTVDGGLGTVARDAWRLDAATSGVEPDPTTRA